MGNNNHPQPPTQPSEPDHHSSHSLGEPDEDFMDGIGSGFREGVELTALIARYRTYTCGRINCSGTVREKLLYSMEDVVDHDEWDESDCVFVGERVHKVDDDTIAVRTPDGDGRVNIEPRRKEVTNTGGGNYCTGEEIPPSDEYGRL